MHRLAGHPIAAGHIGDRRPVVEHLQHRLIALLHQPQLHEHDRPPPDLRARTTHSEEGGTDQQVDPRRCQPGTGATVAQVPGPRPRNCHPATGATVSSMNRSRTPEFFDGRQVT